MDGPKGAVNMDQKYLRNNRKRNARDFRSLAIKYEKLLSI